MDWQTSADSMPSEFVTDSRIRSLLGKPPATGAWREGDPPGGRLFAQLGPLELEFASGLDSVKLAYETWGTLSPARDNAVLVLHALTGDSHVAGSAGDGHSTAGWWNAVVGPGKAIDTDRWFVVAPNTLGGCQGSLGPASTAPDGREWGPRFPYLSIRDQVAAQVALSDHLGIDVWAAVVGGSMGGMQAIEWAVGHPERLERVAVLAASEAVSADQIAYNSLQIDAVRLDAGFADGEYYEASDGEGPHRGLALARRLALLQYRGSHELNARFRRSWQSGISPLGSTGRFAVESYLDFHGNRFSRRFDANSYITLVNAMSSHDVGRGRGGADAALARVRARSLVVGIDSDRMFPVAEQRALAARLPHGIDGTAATELTSEFGHDAFLVEHESIGFHLARLLDY